MGKKPAKKHDKELTEQLQRVQAEFENYRKRVERDREQQQQRAAEHLIRELLPVLDNFELALSHAKENDGEELLKGIAMVQDQLHSILADHNVEKIPTTGKFNPELHEAITTTEENKPEGTITQTLQQGYTLAGKVLRPARVSVVKKGG